VPQQLISILTFDLISNLTILVRHTQSKSLGIWSCRMFG